MNDQERGTRGAKGGGGEQGEKEQAQGEQDEEGEGGESDEEHPEHDEKPDLLERIASWTSAALILGLIGYLARDAYLPDAPPALEARADSVRVAGGQYQVWLTVHNAGDRAAKDIQVRVKLEGVPAGGGGGGGGGGAPPPEAEAHLDWLPGRSRHTTVAVFREDPRRGRIDAEVVGFDLP